MLGPGKKQTWKAQEKVLSCLKNVTSICNPAETPRQTSLPPGLIHMPSGSKVMKKNLYFVEELYL